LRAISNQKVKSVRVGSDNLSSDIVHTLSDSSLLKFTQKRMRNEFVQMVIEQADGQRLILEVAREGQGVRIQKGGFSAFSTSLGYGLARAGVYLPRDY
jgi:hypothetical protein